MTLQVNDHRREPSKACYSDIARRLRVDAAEVMTVLETWTEKELRAHLEKFTHEQLKAPAFRRE